ncbi:MAG: antibiotic biosynthesis monooxygenase family protein [Hyphomicrobiaceae bacterium]
MPKISQTAKTFTLVNVFTVAEGRQDELIRILSNATDDFIAARRGFISTTFHKGDDGKTVVNYAQWEARKDWKAMLATKKAKVHVAEVQAMIEAFQSTPCRVVKVHRAKRA